MLHKTYNQLITFKQFQGQVIVSVASYSKYGYSKHDCACLKIAISSVNIVPKYLTSKQIAKQNAF